MSSKVYVSTTRDLRCALFESGLDIQLKTFCLNTIPNYQHTYKHIRPRLHTHTEATASVDKGTDVQLQRMIRTVFADRTVVTIAHRLETVIEDDRIVVLSDGCVVETGVPFELLSDTAGTLRGMVDSTGRENAARLIQKAKESSTARLLNK
jgi:ABC-type multidrug transport system ATPase subunit